MEFNPANFITNLKYMGVGMLGVLMIVAILGATAFGLPKVQRAYQQAIQRPYGYAIRQIVIIALFIVSVLFMVNSTYSPFIYFQY